jgi:D-amino-acid dehydrogenase
VRVSVIGAGVIGLAITHALLDDGHEVTVLEAQAPVAGASRGNAGWIAHLDIMPLASPKAWRNLPRWLADPLGPLSIRPAHLPELLPWLRHFVRASQPWRIERSIVAIAALNGLSLPAWEKRLAALGLAHHLRRKGILSVWADRKGFEAGGRILARQQALGIAVATLTAAGVREMEPGFSPGIAGGAFYPAGVHVSDPAALTLALAEAAWQRGARLQIDRATGLKAGHDGVVLTFDDGSTLEADRGVIAAGAWSKPLAAAVGDPVPLDTERGYNVTFPPGQLGLSRPVMFEDAGFVTTPLDSGDRVGGSVELAGLKAPPNFARADAILARLRRFLPDANTSGGTRWMGFRPSMPDSLPVIGPATNAPAVIHAFGHAHHGLTQAAATGEIVAAIIAGRTPPIDILPLCAGRFR